MNVAADKGKVRRAFEAARELKLETPTVLEFLASKGYDTSRKQMQPVDEDMFLDLLKRFDPVKLRKYQSDPTVGHDEDQKRDSVRLRQSEIEKLQAAKPSAPELQVTTQVDRKITLPQAQSLKIIEKAPLPPPPPVESAVVADSAPVELTEVAPLPAHVEVEPTAPPVLPKETVIVEAPVSQVVVEPPVLPSPPQLVRRKIELPQARSLKIIEHAPKPVPKVEPVRPAQQPTRGQAQTQQPVRGQTQRTQAASQAPSKGTPQPKPQPQRTTDNRSPAAAASLSLVGGATSGASAKKKLKRKKIITKVETPEEAIESAVAAQLRRDGGKAKVAVKPPDASATASRGRRRKKKVKGAAGSTAPDTGASRGSTRGGGGRKKPVSQQEVTASIKKTMAMMEGRGRGKRHLRGGSQAEEEFDSGKLRLTEFLTTQEFANLLEVPVQDVIKRFIEMGMIISINQRLDRDTVELLAAEFEVEVEFVSDEEISEEVEESKPENLIPRQPMLR